MQSAFPGEMPQWFRIDQRRELGMTTLSVSNRETDLEIKIVSKLNRTERRALMRQLWRQLRPVLERLSPPESVRLNHDANGITRSRQARHQSFRTFAAAPLGTPHGALGAEIQSRRLKQGLKQSELATRLGIHRSHVSALERGHYRASAKVRERLDEVLPR